MSANHLEDLIREGGLKVTPQRMMLLREIDAQGHLDVESLFQRAQSHFPSISLATIYKNVHTLSENGILREVPLSGKRSVYELKHAEHIHYHCTECGKVFDIPADMERISETVRSHTGVSFDAMRITVSGGCEGHRNLVEEKH
ncbi:MAG: Fur family transcriptional regulator [Spirochaetales bacterium]